MTLQTFRELLHQRPFRPFRLVMSSGQTYEVRHPEMALPTRTDLLVGTTWPMMAFLRSSRFARYCTSRPSSR